MLAARLAALSQRQRLVLVGMLLSCAVVITVATVLVVATPTSKGTSSTVPTVTTLSLSALPPPAPTTTQAGTWAPPAPAFAQAVAFAPANSAAIAVCGFAGGTLRLGLSQDGGQTWAAYRAGVGGNTCTLGISPADAKDIALAVAQCQATCDANTPAALYRSVDGGAHWAGVVPPVGVHFGTVLGWAGATLYATTNVAAHPLAVSVGGGAFTLRDDIARFAGAITTLTANGDTMLATLPSPTAGDTPTVVASRSDGAVWSQVSLTDAPFTPVFARISADGSILAMEGQDTLVVSRDTGASWLDATPFPSGQTLGASRFAARTPDGSLVASLQSTRDASKTGLFILAAGTHVWQPLAAPPAGAQLLALAWDAAGHPTALWANTSGHLISDHL
jgi:hypothetical protein